MSGKTKILAFGKGRGEGVGASEVSEPAEIATDTQSALIVGPRPPVDPLQEARDLEDTAMAYAEVVRAIGVITKTTQAGEDSYAGLTLQEMAENLDSAWERWDTAQRRLLGEQRSA